MAARLVRARPVRRGVNFLQPVACVWWLCFLLSAYAWAAASAFADTPPPGEPHRHHISPDAQQSGAAMPPAGRELPEHEQHVLSSEQGIAGSPPEPERPVSGAEPQAVPSPEQPVSGAKQQAAPPPKQPVSSGQSRSSGALLRGTGTIPPGPPPAMQEKLGAVVPEGIFLYDENGVAVDVRSLMDIPSILMPIFLTCPAACNTLQSSVAAALPEVRLQPGKDFRVLAFSFDAADTPELARRKKDNYLAAAGYAVPPEAWRYLTGDADSIKRLADAVGFTYVRVGPGNFVHPVGIIVLAPGGKITRYLYGQAFMPFDLTMALTEAAEGKIGFSVKRLVTYCFAYDPETRSYVLNFTRIAGAVIIFGALVLLFILLLGGKKRGPGSS